MIIVKGDFKRGIEISNWLKEHGLVHEKDYTWYRRSRNKDCAYDCLVFDIAVAKWETMIAMKWTTDVN